MIRKHVYYVAWVHPKRGDDKPFCDYAGQFDFDEKNPETLMEQLEPYKTGIEKEIKRRRSTYMDDYMFFAVPPGVEKCKGCPLRELHGH